MKVLCIGHISYDLTYVVKKFILENTKNKCLEYCQCGGGPISNAAYLLGEYGVDVYVMGLIGNDEFGDKILSEFKKVNTDYVIKTNKSTSLSTIIINEENGSRTIVSKQENEHYPIVDIDFVPDIILIDGYEMDISNYIIDKFPNSISVMDAGVVNDENIKLAKKVNYLICSKEFAEKLTNLKFNEQNNGNYAIICDIINKTINNNTVITLENLGSMTLIDNSLKIVPSINVDVIDSTGAGDLYHGAFIYGLINKYKLEDILKFSNVVGALSVTKLGGRNSVPNLEEVSKYYDTR